VGRGSGNPGHVVHGGRHGQRILVVDLYLDKSPGFQDWSDATLSARFASTLDEIRDLETRIAAWRKDPSVAATDLEVQTARLDALRKSAQSMSWPRPTGSVFNARWIELTRESPRDRSVTEAMGALDRRVNEM